MKFKVSRKYMNIKSECLTRKTLHKLTQDELQEILNDIENGIVFKDDLWKDICN